MTYPAKWGVLRPGFLVTALAVMTSGCGGDSPTTPRDWQGMVSGHSVSTVTAWRSMKTARVKRNQSLVMMNNGAPSNS
jgi:hypothetical protein